MLRCGFALSTGGMQETVQVTADAPLLNTTTGISGTTVDAKQIAELPLGDGTAYMLTRLAPGIADSSDLHFARPADNGNLAGIVANGVQGGNEFTHRRRAEHVERHAASGFSPPSDAIAQFKVQTNAFDAQTGHTAGAVVNLALKSGTNAFHFAGGYFNRNDSRSSTPLLTTRAGGTKPTREYNRCTGTLSGPIVHNKTFFMAVVRAPARRAAGAGHLHGADREDAERRLQRVHDPGLRSGDGDRHRRHAHGVCRQRDSLGRGSIPVAAAYAALYPLPNRPGTVGNYFTNQLRPYDYNARHGTHRSQPQLGQPPVRHDLLEQAPRGSLQLGAGRDQRRATAAPSTGSSSPRGTTTAATSA